MLRSGSIVRSSMPAFRVGDPGPNPGRSTTNLLKLLFYGISYTVERFIRQLFKHTVMSYERFYVF